MPYCRILRWPMFATTRTHHLVKAIRWHTPAFSPQVSPTAQAAITAADALCNFLCCWVLSDSWPFSGVSMGAMLCSNLVLAYLSLLVSNWMDQRRSANPHPSPHAHVDVHAPANAHVRQPGPTSHVEGQLRSEQLGDDTDGVGCAPPQRGSEAGGQEREALVGAEVEPKQGGDEAGERGSVGMRPVGEVGCGRQVCGGW